MIGSTMLLSPVWEESTAHVYNEHFAPFIGNRCAAAVNTIYGTGALVRRYRHTHKLCTDSSTYHQSDFVHFGWIAAAKGWVFASVGVPWMDFMCTAIDAQLVYEHVDPQNRRYHLTPANVQMRCAKFARRHSFNPSSCLKLFIIWMGAKYLGEQLWRGILKCGVEKCAIFRKYVRFCWNTFLCPVEILCSFEEQIRRLFSLFWQLNDGIFLVVY